MTMLRPDEKHALGQIRNGADIGSHVLAAQLRALKKDHPNLLTITPVLNDYDPMESRPFFGAILTAAGKEAIA